MKNEFSALNDFVKSFKPGHSIRMIRKDYSVIAKMQKCYGTKPVVHTSFKMVMLDDLFDPVAASIKLFLPDVLSRLEAKHGPFFKARHKGVFASKFVVIKVPLNERGLIDVFHEAHLYSKKDDENLAPSRIVLINELPVLFMQRLEIDTLQPLPDWAQNVDARQVGLNPKGQFKAYDYGIV